MPDRPLQQIFVSYSHHDAHWREQLFSTYLTSTFGDCHIWSDAQLRAGDLWEPAIEQQLQGAGVAVLLVSENFLNSTFIAERELPLILRRGREAGLRIVWIPIAITRQVLEQRRPELAVLQAAASFDDVLPAQPQACSPATLERVRQQIRQQMRAAVDPLGADLARQVAGRYEIDRWLGEGNLAAVYKARDPLLRRDVAIKVLKDAGQREGFMADVYDAIRMSEEPNFINIYDVGPPEVTAYCVVQHIRGKTLAATLREQGDEGGLQVQTLRRIFVRLAGAITRAHAKGITYGNIKPSNIILDEEFEPFMLPVGRRRDPARERKAVRDLVARLQAAGNAGQAPADIDLEDLTYLVPDHFGEQFEKVDPRMSDQYMLGVLAYEMATGTRPVPVPAPANLLHDGRDAFEPLPPVSRLRRLMPQRICAMVARMAAIDPTQRYPQLKDVLQETDLQADLELVIARDSYRRCAQVADFDAVFFNRFYAEMMRSCAGARPFFEGFGPADWARQHRMLKEAVLLLFAFAQQHDGHAEPNVLSRIAGSHGTIPAALYGPFLDALVRTVCGDEAIGLAPFDPECAQRENAKALARYWRGALAPGIEYLKSRTR